MTRAFRPFLGSETYIFYKFIHKIFFSVSKKNFVDRFPYIFKILFDKPKGQFISIIFWFLNKKLSRKFTFVGKFVEIDLLGYQCNLDC